MDEVEINISKSKEYLNTILNEISNLKMTNTGADVGFENKLNKSFQVIELLESKIKKKNSEIRKFQKGILKEKEDLQKKFKEKNKVETDNLRIQESDLNEKIAIASDKLNQIIKSFSTQIIKKNKDL